MASSDDPSAPVPKTSGNSLHGFPVVPPSSPESLLDIWQEFCAQARKTPHRIAIVEPGSDFPLASRQFSYAWLLTRSRQISNQLRDVGASAEVRVGTLLGRSPDLVAGLLGIFRAGATYVPLDPAQPAARLRRLIADGDLEILLVDPRSDALLLELSRESETPHPRIVRLPETRRSESQPVHRSAGPQDLVESAAYILYTSGSTGTPKGVVVPRGAFAEHCSAAMRCYELEEEERLLVFASPAFDVSLEQIFCPLLCGAALVLAPEQTWAPEELRKLLTPLLLTSVNLPPAYWRQLVALDTTQAPAPHLRRLLLGGEALHPADIRTWRSSALATASLWNVYGPTETIITATFHRFSRKVAARKGEVVPIGRPLDDRRRALVMHRELLEVADGEAGELCIGGPLLARGYLGRPAATAERFVPDPAATHPGGRLYKTGDRVRLDQAGELVFLHRNDQQMKLHGVRIEPGEIETALGDLPEVRQAVVVKAHDPSRLVAFVVPQAEDIAPQRLRQHLAEHLPASMVPATFVETSRLPLTTTGKVDRALLAQQTPLAEGSSALASETLITPRNALEATLLDICRGVLGLRQLGVEDHLFEVGSDSILNLRIAAKAQRAGLRITSKDLFEHPTVAGLAALPHLRHHATLRGVGDPDPGLIPLTPIQRWFFAENDLPARQHFNQAILLTVERPLPPAALHGALAALLAHHDALRLRFASGKEGWQQYQSPPGTSTPVLLLDLSRLPRDRRTPAMEGAAGQLQASLALARPPLLRAAFFRLGDADRLLLIVHHLAVDSVSWAILLADLETACRRLVVGEMPRLPAKTTSFKAWAELLGEHAGAPATTAELRHWTSLPAEPALPIEKASFQDSPRINTRASLREVEWRLSEEETQRLVHHLPTTFRARVDEVLLTALLLAWERFTGHRALRVDLEGHGREDLFAGVDVSRTVGWFTTIFPVHLEADLAADARAVLQMVGEQVRAVPRHGIGFGLLRYLGDPGHISELPSSAAVNFNYLGQLDRLWHGTAASAERFFGPADGPTGPWRAASGRRVYPLEIEAAVRSGRLTMRFRYSHHLHHRATLESLAASCRRELRRLIDLGSRRPAPFRGEVEDIYPTSPLQQGMLFHSLYAPASTLYREQSSWTLTGHLDVGAWSHAWSRLLARHPALRTAFFTADAAAPRACVHRQVGLPLRVVDWRGLSTAARREKLPRLLLAERRRGFDLERPPLLRLLLVRLEEDSWRFVWTLHHSLLDGWSLSSLFDELFILYEAFAAHRPEPDLPAPPRFREYIGWLDSQSLDPDFWRRHLGGLGPPTPPPGAEHDPGGITVEPMLKEGRLSTVTSAALQNFTRRHHLTLNTVVQGAWALELSRAADTTEVVFGATLTHRPESLPGAERMVGLLLNTLPVRVRITPHDHLLPWLRELQEQNLELRQRGHTPLPAARQAAGLPGDHPLFETLLAFQNFAGASRLRKHRGNLALGDLLYFNHSHYPLTLQVIPVEELRIQARFAPHRLNAVTVERMLRRLTASLARIVDHRQDRPLVEIPWLTREERHQVLVEWNDRSQIGTPPPFLERFEHQVGRAAEAIALVGDGTRGMTQALSFGELARRSAGLGQELRARGVDAESRVGLCLERSPELIVAILAVLRAGGAWLPLDTAYPPQRLAFMVEDARLTLLLIERDLDTALEFPDTLQKFVLPTPPPRALLESTWTPPPPEQLAYLIYTSGSTGRPKGAQLCHGGLAALARARPLLTRSGDTVLQFSSASFDASVFETILAFAAGATLHMARGEDLLPGPPLEALLQRRRITQAVLPPSALAALLPGTEQRLPALRTVLVAGEACPAELARRFCRDRSFIDAYGPTETTVCATAAHWYEGSTEQRPPIGRPILGTSTYLLDRRLRPIALGVPGELCVGGAGVGRGYLRRPALTAERFVPDPFTHLRSGRLYRTGDRVRHLSDGRLDFLGRFDHQVKLRGFRIEPGEIEAALSSQPAVREAVAGLQPGAPGELTDEQLVAWVVPTNDAEQQGAKDEREPLLRRQLEKLLPAHMVPTRFIFLDQLPLTPNGKVDRAALRALRPESRAHATGSPPRDTFEQAVAECWRQVLGLKDPGRGDHFFELGGHSLLATRVLAHLDKRLGINLRLRDLFEHPILEDLAAVLRQMDGQPKKLASSRALHEAFEEITL